MPFIERRFESSCVHMNIEISKTDYHSLSSLIDKAVGIIQNKNPTNQEYNVARMLRQVKKKILKKNEKTINETFGA